MDDTGTEVMTASDFDVVLCEIAPSGLPAESGKDLIERNEPNKVIISVEIVSS